MKNELEPKVCDVSLCVPPRIAGKKQAAVIATCTVLAWPVRINSCALVKYPDGAYAVWTPTPELKLVAQARPAILEAAKAAYREALATVHEVEG